MTVFPSVADFKVIIQSNGIRNCPVALEDIKNAQTIYGKCLGTATLKGKSTHGKMRVAMNDCLEVPKEIKLRNEDVASCADVMFIQQVSFLISISKKIKFIDIVAMASEKHKELLEAFDQTFGIHNHDGFDIESLHVDPEFELLCDAMIDNWVVL